MVYDDWIIQGNQVVPRDHGVFLLTIRESSVEELIESSIAKIKFAIGYLEIRGLAPEDYYKHKLSAFGRETCGLCQRFYYRIPNCEECPVKDYYAVRRCECVPFRNGLYAVLAVAEEILERNRQ